MDFIFQGFQSALPVWVYVLVFIGTSVLAWWSYSPISGIRKAYRYTLVALRSTVFFILLLLLVNPFLKTKNTYYEKPNILVFLDNSASTSVEKSQYQGVKTYQEVLAQLNFADSSSVSYNFFSVGNETTPSGPDNLRFDADQTNLSQAIQVLKGNQSEATAAVLLSDGVYTKGQNPVFEAENLDIPLFTIGLSDTTFQKDILVSSVTSNSTGYVNSTQPVTATISSKGFQGQAVQVQLRKGDQIIKQQTITPEISNSSIEVSFDLPLEEQGLQQYNIHVPKLADEWTGANNMQRFSVDVKDAKQQILSLAFEIHPDVRVIRSLLLSDQNTNLTKRTWLQGDSFIEGNLSFDPDTVDLAIIHGYPRSGLPSSVQQNLTELTNNVPSIIAATPLFSPQRFEQQLMSLPVSVTGNWSYNSVTLTPEADPTAHPVMELPAVTYDRLPNLSAPLNNIGTAPGARILFSSTFQGQATQNPLLSVQELGNRRISLVSGYGWYKLKQSQNPQVRDFVDQLWLNLVSWTATDPENQLLEVRPTQTSFTGSEPVVINAFLNNERGEVEADATIDISVSSDSMEAQFYTMENRGGGQYQLDLGTMAEGLYSFEATAQKGDRTLETQSGEFAVAKSNVEFLDINRNDQLLGQLASRTGGEYVPYDSVDGFWNRLEQRDLLEQQEKVHNSFFYPYQHLAWFVVVLLLLCGEWVLRKYLSLP